MIFFLHGCKAWSLTSRDEHTLRVSEKRVLRKIFGPKTDKVIRACRRLHNVEPYDRYSAPNIVRLSKSRIMGLAGHVARTRDMRQLGRIILKWIFKKWDEEAWTGLIWLRIGTGGWLL